MKDKVEFCAKALNQQYWQLDRARDLPVVPHTSKLIDFYDEGTTPDDIRHTFQALREVQTAEMLSIRNLLKGRCLPPITYTQGLVRITLDVLSDERLGDFPATSPINKLYQNRLAEEMTQDVLHAGPRPVYCEIDEEQAKARVMSSTVLYGLQSFSGDQMLFLEAAQVAPEASRGKNNPVLLPQATRIGQLYSDRSRYMRITDAKLLASAVEVELPETKSDWVASNARRMVMGFDAA